MIRGVVVQNLNKIQWLFLVLVVLGCVVFWGIDIRKTEPEPLTTEWDILINPLGLIQGLLVGLLSSVIVYRLLSLVRTSAHKKHRSTMPRQIGWLLCFCILTGVIFSFLVIVQIEQHETITILVEKNIFTFSFLFGLLSSWAIVGNRIIMFVRVGEFFDKFFMMLLDRLQFDTQKEKHYKVLFITGLIAMYLILFPPWKAYDTVMGNKGLGQPDFAGFHFISSRQYSILGESPYGLAEIDRSFQLLLIAVTLVIGVFLYLSIPRTGGLCKIGHVDEN